MPICIAHKIKFFKKYLFYYLLFPETSCIISYATAGVMELVDVVDSKSTDGDIVPVRVRPPAPNKKRGFRLSFLFSKGKVLEPIAEELSGERFL